MRTRLALRDLRRISVSRSRSRRPPVRGVSGPKRASESESEMIALLASVNSQDHCLALLALSPRFSNQEIADHTSLNQRRSDIRVAGPAPASAATLDGLGRTRTDSDGLGRTWMRAGAWQRQVSWPDRRSRAGRGSRPDASQSGRQRRVWLGLVRAGPDHGRTVNSGQRVTRAPFPCPPLRTKATVSAEATPRRPTSTTAPSPLARRRCRGTATALQEGRRTGASFHQAPSKQTLPEARAGPQM